MGMFADVGSPADIDAVVRAQLADSIAHIADRASHRLKVSCERIDAALSAIRAAKQDPGVFARYYDLVPAVLTGDFELADKLLAEIADLATQPATFAIVSYERELLV